MPGRSRKPPPAPPGRGSRASGAFTRSVSGRRTEWISTTSCSWRCVSSTSTARSGDEYAERFQHVLVDEYQDTNRVQFHLVRRLAQRHGNICVVGDDDQSIYGWRGADITNILEFERHFPGATILRMEQNYRSTGRILEVANAIARHNRDRKEKSLWTENGTGEPVRLYLAEEEEEEARYVGRRIREALRAGAPSRAIAILYRTHAQSRPLEDALPARGGALPRRGGRLLLPTPRSEGPPCLPEAARESPRRGLLPPGRPCPPAWGRRDDPGPPDHGGTSSAGWIC